MYEHVIKYFDKPDEVREFPKGRFELVTVRGLTIGRATYQPGWKWSEHVAPIAKVPLCEVEHLGVVLSGQASYAPGVSSTFRPFLTTAGSSETSRMCRSICKARNTTRSRDAGHLSADTCKADTKFSRKPLIFHDARLASGLR